MVVVVVGAVVVVGVNAIRRGSLESPLELTLHQAPRGQGRCKLS